MNLEQSELYLRLDFYQSSRSQARIALLAAWSRPHGRFHAPSASALQFITSELRERSK